MLAELGALDVYVLPAGAGTELIEAREKAFWVAKANGANDIIDIVVPRASIPEFMRRVGELGREHQTLIAGLRPRRRRQRPPGGVPEAIPPRASRLMHGLFAAGMALGGAISGEHGIGTEKKKYFLELEDPAKSS